MDKRAAYIEKIKAKLDELNAGIDVLEARGRDAQADMRIKIDEELGTLKQRREEAKAHLENLRNAGDEAWEDMKDGVELAWSSLGEAVKSAVARFK